MSVELEDIIKQHVMMLVENKNGWYKTRCLVCDDHQPGSPNFKGLRGNFKLSGNNIGYNCYNCDANARYEDGSQSFSKSMIKIFDAFNIPESMYFKILVDSIGQSPKPKQDKTKLIIEPAEIKLPDHFYLLSEADPNDQWSIIATHYLENRKIDPSMYPFYLSTGEGKFASKWKRRVIMPFYKDAKLIFYQGRALLPSIIRKYESPSVNKSNIIYNYEAINTYSKKPLFVVEGFFDAYLINGIALNGKNITEAQAVWLNRSNRTKVIIPDREGDGNRIAHQALDLGWCVSTPNFGKCKDVNDAIIRYGKLYVIKEIMDNIYSDKIGRLMVDKYCKK